MKTTSRLFVPILAFYGFLALALLGIFQAIAMADGPAPAPSGVSLALPTGWPLLALMVLVIASWAVRKYTNIAFFHTAAGAAVMGIFSAVVPGVIQAILHGANLAAIEAAAAGAVFSFFASDNPSNSTAQQSLVVKAMRTKSAAMVLLFAGLFLGSGCTPGALALGKCELNALPQTFESILVGITSIAAQPGANAVADLEQFGQSVGPSIGPTQFNCAVQAVEVALKAKTVKGQESPVLVTQIKNLDDYLAKHPATACREGWTS